MKKLFICLLSFFMTTTAFGYKVQTEIYELGMAGDEVCCYYMVHFIYDDNGHFLTYGFSSMGDCCRGEGGIDINTTNLTDQERMELQEYLDSDTFSDHYTQVIEQYKIEQSNGVKTLNVNPNPSTQNVHLSFEAQNSGPGKVIITPIVGGNSFETNIQVIEGENNLVVEYYPQTNLAGPNFYIISVVIDNEIFRTIAMIE